MNAEAAAGGGAQAGPSSEEEITISGAVVTSYASVTALKMQLVAGMGETSDSRTVLVPFVDVDLQVTRGASAKEDSVTVLLAFDNAAFLLDEMAEAFARMATQLEDLSQGTLAPQASGLTYALGRIGQARSSLDDAQTTLLRVAEAKQRSGQASAPEGGPA